MVKNDNDNGSVGVSAGEVSISTDNVGTDPRLWGIGESDFRVWYRVCGGATPNTF